MARFGYGLVCMLAACGLGDAALAADLSAKMPVKAAPYVAMTNWTGFYVGGHLGAGWVNQSATLTNLNLGGGIALDPLGTSYGLNKSGFLGGLQFGYNYQVQNWVFGVGADFSWTSVKAESITPGTLVAGSSTDLKSKTDWYATLTGKVGYAFDNVLVYGKGGAAWTHQVYGGYSAVGAITETYSDVAATRTGWTLGAGLEWAFAPHWSVFGEYDYLDFGTKNYVFVGSLGDTANFDIKTKVSQGKLGLNYRF